MKFGENLKLNLTHEWKKQYIDYEKLKGTSAGLLSATWLFLSRTEYEYDRKKCEPSTRLNSCVFFVVLKAETFSGFSIRRWFQIVKRPPTLPLKFDSGAFETIQNFSDFFHRKLDRK